MIVLTIHLVRFLYFAGQLAACGSRRDAGSPLLSTFCQNDVNLEERQIQIGEMLSACALNEHVEAPFRHQTGCQCK